MSQGYLTEAFPKDKIALGANWSWNKLNVNLRAKKALVVGKYSSGIFFEVYNLLNQDNLRVYTYEPDRGDNSGRDELGLRGPLQIDAVRRFGRRFQVGFQIDF